MRVCGGGVRILLGPALTDALTDAVHIHMRNDQRRPLPVSESFDLTLMVQSFTCLMRTTQGRLTRKAPMLIKHAHDWKRDYNNIPNDLGTAVNVQVRWCATFSVGLYM